MLILASLSLSIRPFGLDACDQLIRITFNQANANASFRCETIIKRAIRIIMARGIEIERAFLRRHQGRRSERCGKGQGKQGTTAHEGNLSARDVISRWAAIKGASPSVRNSSQGGRCAAMQLRWGCPARPTG